MPLNNTSITHVCYNGSKKGGTHTKKQFLDIMNKSSSISWKKSGSNSQRCIKSKRELKYKSCKKERKILKYMTKIIII